MKKKASSYIQLTGGRWRGKKIMLPCENDASGKALTRPTLSRVRQSLFDILIHGNFLDRHGMANIANIGFVDVFAGSGAVGFEAASHGFSPVFMVEQAPNPLKVIADNIRQLDAGKNQIIPIRGDGFTPIIYTNDIANFFNKNAHPPLDAVIVFFDPPYSLNNDDWNRMIDYFNGKDFKGQAWHGDKFLFILQAAHSFNYSLPNPLTNKQSHHYGKTRLHFFK